MEPSQGTADPLLTSSAGSTTDRPYGATGADAAACDSSAAAPFPPIVPPRPSLLDRVLLGILHASEATVPWHRLPTLLGLGLLAARRVVLQRLALLPVGGEPSPAGAVPPPPVAVPYRTPDGSGNDREHPYAGAHGVYLGRNVPPVPVGERRLHEPSPQVVAERLLARRRSGAGGVAYKHAGDQFNVVAAAWIQFMVHSWLRHINEPGFGAGLPEGTADGGGGGGSGGGGGGGDGDQIGSSGGGGGRCPLSSFTFPSSREEGVSPAGDGGGFRTSRTMWWDGSALYGQTEGEVAAGRTGKGGEVRVGPARADGPRRAGDQANTWVGMTVLQELFGAEHNAVVRMLAGRYPGWDDEQLFRVGRLVVAAVIAKIHTVDWTVELLKTKTLYKAMNANWNGLLGAGFKDRFGHIGSSPNVLSGLVGARKTANHGVPYSLTEEFTAVYRLHTMLPDELPLPSPGGGATTLLTDVFGDAGEATLAAAGAPAVWTALGSTPCGTLSLFNYPAALRTLVPTDDDGSPRVGRPVDLAALDIYRDRERGVARYNAFRRALHLPPLRRWEDLTADAEALTELRAVYGDGPDGLERLDLLVGHLAEDKIPGFVLPQPAFLIFIAMASRRLEADAMFNTHFTEEVYTPEGMAWVRNVGGLRDVLHRHMPDVAAGVGSADSAFSRWGSPPGKRV